MHLVDLGLANYFKGSGRTLVVMIDMTNGLDRSAESPALVARGRSLSEPAVQQVYDFLKRAVLHKVIDGVAQVAEFSVQTIHVAETGFISDDSFETFGYGGHVQWEESWERRKNGSILRSGTTCGDKALGLHLGGFR